MSDFVLKARLDALEKNLQAVSDVLELVEEGREEITELWERLRDIEKSINIIDEYIRSNKNALRLIEIDLEKVDFGKIGLKKVDLGKILVKQDKSLEEVQKVKNDFIKKAWSIIIDMQKRSVETTLVNKAADEIKKIMAFYQKRELPLRSIPPYSKTV